MNVFFNFRKYPVTSSLMMFNCFTYCYSFYDSKAKKKFTIEKWESYIRRDELPNLNALLKNFTHFNSSFAIGSLGINLLALRFIAKNMEIVFGSKIILLVELSNYLSHLMSFYFSSYRKLDLFFIQKQSHDYSLPITLGLLLPSLPINIPNSIKFSVFLFSWFSIVFFNFDNYLVSPIISTILVTLYVRRFRVIL